MVARGARYLIEQKRGQQGSERASCSCPFETIAARCPAGKSNGAVSGHKIKVANPVVDLDGDEMTRWVAGSAMRPHDACAKQSSPPQALSCAVAAAAASSVIHLGRWVRWVMCVYVCVWYAASPTSPAYHQHNHPTDPTPVAVTATDTKQKTGSYGR